MAKRRQTTGIPKSPRPEDPLIGKTLGDYQVMRLISRGSLSGVYEGRDVHLDRTVALKVLQADTSPQNEMSLERFQREARAIARLNHPNIVGIYQFGQAEDVYYIAMEFIKGVDLWQELRQLRQSQQMISVEYALGIMDQMASALDYAHLQGIIHRDVKPSNIMLAKDQAVLTNFGLVLFQAEGSMGNTFGTPRYISPEQAISSNQALPQSDIYSLAVVLYECLVGETPFAGDSPMEIALSHITEPAPIPSSRNNAIPQAVDAALLKALDKDPKARFESATSFIHAVRGGYSLSPQSPLSPSRSTSTDTQPMRAVNVTSSAPSKSVPGASHATTTPPIRKTAPPAPRPQPARTGMPVFVSYSSKNATERAQVVDELVKLDTVKRDEAHEKGVWFDDGLKQHGGQEWWDLILGQVVNRDLFVFVLTSESLLSFACYLEYTYAHALNKWILPVKSQPFEIPLLPPALKGTQIVDFTGKDRVAQLKGSVADIARQNKRPAPLTPIAPPPIPYDDFTPVAAPLLNTTEPIPAHNQHALYSMLESLAEEDRTRTGATILLNMMQSRGDTVHQVGRKIEKLLENINNPGFFNRFFGRKGR